MIFFLEKESICIVGLVFMNPFSLPICEDKDREKFMFDLVLLIDLIMLLLLCTCTL